MNVNSVYLRTQPQLLILGSCADRQSGFQVGRWTERSADAAVRKKKKTIKIAHEHKWYKHMPARMLPDKTKSPTLLSDRGGVGKLATGKSTSAKDNKRAATEKLKIAKNTLRVGTWNDQILRAAGILELLGKEMKRLRYDIVDISKVRWIGKVETPIRDFIWSEDKTHVRGTGMLLSDRAKKALIGYTLVSSGVVTARFGAASYKIAVTHGYAPTMVSSDENISAFYSILKDALAKVRKKDIIITGSWNSKIGSDRTDWESIMGRYRYNDRNERGQNFLEFAAIQSLHICNTRFEQKPQQK